MNISIKSILVSALLIAITTACSGAPSSTPNPVRTATASASQPVSSATRTSVPAATKPTAPVAQNTPYDGDWSGDAGPDLPLNFSLENGQLTDINLNYSLKKDSCYLAGNNTSDPASVTWSGKTLTVKGAKDKIQYTFIANFTSDREASGTIDWKGSTSCGDVIAQTKWSAKKSAE